MLVITATSAKIVTVKYIYYYILNAFWSVISLLEKSDELGYLKQLEDLERAYQEFSGEVYPQRGAKEFEEQWRTVINGLGKFSLEEVESIHLVQGTFYLPYIHNLMDYFVTNEFWGLLNSYSVDAENWTDEEYFEPPRFRIYFLKHLHGQCMITVKFSDGQFTLPKYYSVKPVCLALFSNRMLIYKREVGFMSV